MYMFSTDLAVTINVTYTSPADFESPFVNDFRAGSGPVTLTCQVERATGPVTYQWTSTCGNCFAKDEATQSVTLDFPLRASLDDGTHTCTATDSDGGETGCASTVMRIIGMFVSCLLNILPSSHIATSSPAGIGVFVFEYPEASSVLTGGLPNNGIVVALSSQPPGEPLTFAFQCRSGSRTDTSVRHFIGLDGQSRVTGGGLGVSFLGGQPSAIAVNNLQRPDLSAGEEGVYTCRMLDENGDTVDANIGIYRNGFNSE